MGFEPNSIPHFKGNKHGTLYLTTHRVSKGEINYMYYTSEYTDLRCCNLNLFCVFFFLAILPTKIFKKYGKMWHFINVFTVCLDKTSSGDRKKYIIFKFQPVTLNSLSQRIIC